MVTTNVKSKPNYAFEKKNFNFLRLPFLLLYSPSKLPTYKSYYAAIIQIEVTD